MLKTMLPFTMLTAPPVLIKMTASKIKFFEANSARWLLILFTKNDYSITHFNKKEIKVKSVSENFSKK